MSLFKKKEKEGLLERSNKALGLFTTVVEELKEITEISKSKQDSLSKAKDLIELEISDLEAMNNSNEKIIENINSLLK
jgi:hypothetical protein